MNIREQLRLVNSRHNSDVVEAAVIEHEGKLVELLVCFLGDDGLLVQRSAAVIGNLGRHHPELLKPWWGDLVDMLDEPQHPAVARNVTRYFSELKLPIPRALERRLVDLCLAFVADPDEKTATAAFSMQFVADRADRFPDQAQRLVTELIAALPRGSTGFCNRGKKMLDKLAPGWS